MKAAILYGPKDLRLTQFPEPPMDDNAVKIAVAYCGLCGTDFHKFSGRPGARAVTYPVPLGHEVSGIVVEVGKNVTTFKPGDRVTVDPNHSCGRCHFCRSGKSHLCQNSRGVVKGMAQFVCPPQENVYHLPDSLDLRVAALTEPLSCCLRGMDQLDLHLGQTVAIIGMGAIGQMMLQLCRHASAGPIIVIEPVEEKRQLAMELGATLFINPNKEDVTATIRKAGIVCVDRVLECVGLPQTAATALEIADHGATVVLFGVADRDAVLPVKLYEAFLKELTIKTSYINPHTTQRAIDLLATGAIQTQGLIQDLTMEQLPREMETRALSRLGKVIVSIPQD